MASQNSGNSTDSSACYSVKRQRKYPSSNVRASVIAFINQTEPLYNKHIPSEMSRYYSHHGGDKVRHRSNLNSLAPSRFCLNFRWVIFKQILVIDGWVISCEITLRWMSQGLTDDKSTLVQVMSWCRQATRHYLSQCWRISLSPYGVTRPQWIKLKHATICSLTTEPYRTVPYRSAT